MMTIQVERRKQIGRRASDLPGYWSAKGKQDFVSGFLLCLIIFVVAKIWLYL